MKPGDVETVFAGARVDESVPLAPLTTLRVGPVASRVITCASTASRTAAGSARSPAVASSAFTNSP